MLARSSALEASDRSIAVSMAQWVGGLEREDPVTVGDCDVGIDLSGSPSPAALNMCSAEHGQSDTRSIDAIGLIPRIVDQIDN